MNLTQRRQLAARAMEPAATQEADVDAALDTGTAIFWRRLRRAYAAGVLAVLLLTGGVLWGWSALAESEPPPHATLSSIAVTPGAPTLAPGKTLALHAIGTWSDHTTRDVTSSVTWTTGNPKVATVTAQGLVTATGAGATAVTAAQGGVTGSATVTVTTAPVTLTTIRISPSPLTLTERQQRQAHATGTYSDGTTRDLTSTVTWTTSDPKVATVTAQGLVTATGTGTSTLTAIGEGLTSTATVRVTATPVTTLTAITISPSPVTLTEGEQRQASATGSYSDGTSRDLTSTVTWTTGDPYVATVTAQGVVRATGTGTTTLTATKDTVTATVTVTVSAAPVKLTGISLQPNTFSLSPGRRRLVRATGTYSDGSTRDLDGSTRDLTVTWTTGDPAVATVSTDGVVTGRGTGSTTLTATQGDVTGRADVTVTPPPTLTRRSPASSS